MALGSDPARTFRLVVIGALKVVLIGVAVGLAGAAAVSQSLQSLLVGVPSLDPATYALAGLALVVVGFGAASLPALRATRVDPVVALRQD
jgi:ABC-type antimicrobial peptide transport system permease subunit